MRGLIYADQAGQPGALLTGSFESTVNAGRPPGWVGLSLPYTVDLRPGWYWLGIQTSVEHNVARYSWESVAGSRRYNIDAFATGRPAPSARPISDDQSIAIHALGF